MSMDYCHRHDRHFDTDVELTCHECDVEAQEIEDAIRSICFDVPTPKPRWKVPQPVPMFHDQLRYHRIETYAMPTDGPELIFETVITLRGVFISDIKASTRGDAEAFHRGAVKALNQAEDDYNAQR